MSASATVDPLRKEDDMAELTVAKKSVWNLLSEMQRRKFIIPDYQRPYKWIRKNAKPSGRI
jgi:uncharacterized protein with ParB-like and HNH nuclease domain